MKYEKTDVIIVQQMIQSVIGGADSINTIRDGNDVFVFLLYYAGLTCSLTMEDPSHSTTLIDITAAVKKQTGMVASSSTYIFLLCHCGTVVWR